MKIEIDFETFSEYCNQKGYGWDVPYCQEIAEINNYQNAENIKECNEKNCPVFNK